MGLTRLLYNLLLLWGLLVLAPLWIGYLVLVPKARAGFWEKLGFYPPELVEKLEPQGDRERIWFHAVSVGEFNAIKTLIPELREDYEVIVSTTTRTGHDLAQRTFPDLPVLYFPYDLRPTVHRAMQTVRPDLVVITETEIWPNFIDVATQHYQTPLLLINGRLSRHSCKGYQWIKLLIKPCLNQITHLYMQSQADADRIGQLGDLPPDQMTVVGNLKFDLIPSLDPARRTVLAQLLNIAEDDTVLACASTHSGEDQFLVETYQLLRKDFPELKLVLAPRHPERAPEIKSILNSKALSYALRSQLSEENPNRQPIVVLDSIGELMTVYSLSRIAIMGGSFVEKGGQNPLEPLSQRVPVIFGPHMENFTEISRMILECRAGTQVHNQPELVNAVTELLTQPEIYDTVVETGLQLLENNRGAKEIILKAIRSYLS
jgi:3-deoxy-D-manno-octulosonic-acid transferase